MPGTTSCCTARCSLYITKKVEPSICVSIRNRRAGLPVTQKYRFMELLHIRIFSKEITSKQEHHFHQYSLRNLNEKCPVSRLRNMRKCAFSRSFFLLKDGAKIQIFFELIKKGIKKNPLDGTSGYNQQTLQTNKTFIYLYVIRQRKH